MMIDSHCHISSLEYSSIRSQIINTFQQAGGRFMIDISTTLKNLPDSIKIHQDYPHVVKIALGLHPENLMPSLNVKGDILKNILPNKKSVSSLYIDHAEKFFSKLPAWESKVKLVIKQENVVAIGETGFDTYYFSELQTVREQKYIVNQQARLFKSHVQLAKNYKLPLIIHHRGDLFYTFNRLLDILQEYHFDEPVIFHSFVGNKTDLQCLQHLDYYIGCNGIITYSGTRELRETLQLVPLDRLLLETDSPYLTPSNTEINYRLSEKLNQPVNVLAVAKILGKILRKSSIEVLDITTVNALRLFH